MQPKRHPQRVASLSCGAARSFLVGAHGNAARHPRRRCAPCSIPSALRAWPAPASPRTGSSACARAPAERFAHFTSHQALHFPVHSYPHPCGRFRRRIWQRASHDCPRPGPHRRPLTRRGGSPSPGSPASSFPPLKPPSGAVLYARGGSVLTPHAPRVLFPAGPAIA